MKILESLEAGLQKANSQERTIKEYNISLKRYETIFPKSKIDDNTEIFVTEKVGFKNEEWDKSRVLLP